MDATTAADETRIFIGTLKDLGVVAVKPVEPESEEEALWDTLARESHPLGYKRLPGRRIKYLARVGKEFVAALSFSGSAPKIEVRDRWIGWSPEGKKIHRSRLVNNSRFLTLPEVRIRYLPPMFWVSPCGVFPSTGRCGSGLSPGWSRVSWIRPTIRVRPTGRPGGICPPRPGQGPLCDGFRPGRVLGGFLPRTGLEPVPQKNRNPVLPSPPKTLPSRWSPHFRRALRTGLSFPKPSMSLRTPWRKAENRETRTSHSRTPI
ncbi:MAG: Druantia anti-phage system protein DruA [Leptospirales bacterium]